MGNEICTCLNNLAGLDSEDLSREGNDNNNNTKNNKNIKKVNKKPKVVLHRKDSLDSSEPVQSQKEKESISTNLNSDNKNTLSSHNQMPAQKKSANKKKINAKLKNKAQNNSINSDSIDNKNFDKRNNENNINNNIDKNIDIKDNNINNININKNKVSENNNNNNVNKNKNIVNNKNKSNNNNNSINSKKNEVKNKEEEKIDLNKILNREHMVSENFNKFFNSQNGQEMILNMNETKNKMCITLHKYFVSLITRRKYKKYLKYFLEEKNSLFQKCLDLIYNTNPDLQKIENISPIKYTPDGYLKYYTDAKDQEKMKFDPKKDSFDNCIIINYEEDDSSSIEKILWVYKGQVNKMGFPHGLGEKIFKKGIKKAGYWNSGQMSGWGMVMDIKGFIFIGPFFDEKGVTGNGEKFALRKRAVYKGEFMDGEKSGKGEEDSNEGFFEGNYYHDKKNGKGKMIYKLTGDIYEGDYKNDLFDGQGHYIWKITGQQYTGDYKEGLMHGKGLFEYSEGEYYKGDFVNGKKEGQGELHMGNGRVYIGPFVNGRPNGVGIFDNGFNFKGEAEFIDGKMNINYLKEKYTNTTLSTNNILTENSNINNNNNVINNKEEQVIKG